MTNISTATGIRCCRGTWDVQLQSIQPDSYFVWRITYYNDDISSENDCEIESRKVRISLFSKNGDTIDAAAESIIEQAAANDAKAYMLDFEDFEEDTKYYHKEIELLI